IYVAVDSCETTQKIWLRVQQMMKGSDIRIQEKKAKNDLVAGLPKFKYHKEHLSFLEDVLKHNQLMKLIQFLMGLNDVFQPIKSSLLSRETLSDVKDAFAIISIEESHRGIASSSSGSVSKPRVSSLVAKSNNWTHNGNKMGDNKKVGNTINSSNNKGPNPNLLCTNCGKVVHTIDRCFDIISYLPGYNKNLGSKQNCSTTFNANSASTSNEKGVTLSFTNDQIMKLIIVINDVPSRYMLPSFVLDGKSSFELV
nr:ribonuclease H-like domain-containing protein [Tanacetum cinerariifolium]